MSETGRHNGKGPDARTPTEPQAAGRDAAASDDVVLERRLVDRLRGAVGSGPSGCALGGTVRVGVRDGRVQLLAANRFGADLAERRYLPIVRPIVREELGRPGADVEIVIDPSVADHRKGPDRVTAFDRDRGPGRVAGADDGARFGPGRPGSVGMNGGANANGTARGSRDAETDDAVIDGAGANGAGLHGAARETEPRAESPRPGASVRRRAAQRAYRLDDFVVGPSNRLAYNAAISLACEEDASVSVKLLVLHGPCGVGKTHLLRGLSQAYADRRGSGSVRTVTAESFTNEYVESVRTGKIDAFRARYRSIGLLCVDDVHFVAAKPGTQSELMHTLDQLGLRGSRVVLVSDEHPRLIKQLSAPLRSRFSSGAVVGIEPPGDELCRALTERFARERGMVFAGAAVDAIVSRARAEVDGGSSEVGARELKGLVLQVEATLNSAGRGGGAARSCEPIGASTVERALAQREIHRASGPRRPVRVREIAEIVCAELGVEPDELGGPGRHRRVVLARSVASYLSKKLTTRSYPEIAMDLGRRTHSTVLAARRRIEAQIASGALGEVGCELDGMTVAALVSRIEQRIRVRR